MASDWAGPSFRLKEVSRGAAFGDIDNDGDVDVLVANNNGSTRLLINRVGSRNHWLGLRCVLSDSNRDALGAKIEVLLNSGKSLWRRVKSDGSFCSARDPRVVIGLGQDAKVNAVKVTWPNGTRETFPVQSVDHYMTLREGKAPREKGSK